MGVPTGRKWIAFSLLAVVLPVSLMVTLRLTGILPEPQTPETITIDEVEWEMERASEYVRIEETVENTYTNSAIRVNTSVSIHSYFENGLADPYWNRDGIAFRVNINATTLEGSITSIVVRFFPSDVNATIYTGAFLRSYNNTITYIKHIGTNTDIASVEARVSRTPCFLAVPAHWVFTDQNLENHQLKVNIKITYSNEETYQTIVIPIILKALIVSI